MSERKKSIIRISIAAVCIVGLVVAWLGFGQRGLVRLYETEMERQTYIERIRQLTQENQALMEEIHRLRTDEKYVESIARKQFNMVRENEKIYRFGKEDIDSDVKSSQSPLGQAPALKDKAGQKEQTRNGKPR
ncbi:Septum formation initiator (modular protein) [uncultured Desulfobacterium sp.]|uniref:Septum formation initiator (Modular protein) n=1 Tax=uncultured Desulfobacterium sp. TaxID=201089 RepID=A0A445N027_9BACT|nr:Septum formation initiator (modular protein) [uncultured Desulfobacterium sp.]